MAAKASATGHEPLNTLKPVADNIWLIDGPTEPCGRLPCPTRATVVRLRDGGLWVHSPTLLADRLRQQIEALGPVAHLVAPNRHHATHLGAWQQAFPPARTHALPEMALSEANDLEDHAPDYWAADIDQAIAAGSRLHDEAAFFHKPTETLIVTDLIENIDTAYVAPHLRPLFWLSGNDSSDGKMRMARRISFRKDRLAEAIERMIAWEPRRIILAHGHCYERNAVEELRRAFRRILRDREWIAAMDRIEEHRARKRD